MVNGCGGRSSKRIWSHIGSRYDFREKAERGLGATGFGLSYTLSRQLPDDQYPWNRNLLKTLAVLDGFMGGGGCVYEHAPVLRDRVKAARGILPAKSLGGLDDLAARRALRRLRT